MRYLSAFFIPFLLSLAITPIVKYAAIKFGCVSYPNEKRWHKKPTALLGGIGIFIAFFATLIYLFGGALVNNKTMLGFIIGCTIVFLTGLIDDFIHIKAHSKLIGQIIASCVLLASGVMFGFLPSGLLNIFATILSIVGITNAFNLLDNMDGLSVGIAVISSMMLFIYAISGCVVVLALLSLAIGGSAAGFLIYNFNPAKIFMGDSGSLFLGFVVASLALIGTKFQMSNILATLAVPVLILS